MMSRAACILVLLSLSLEPVEADWSAASLGAAALDYTPRLLVSGSLLIWGISDPELPTSARVQLPPGNPATLNDPLNTAGTMTTLLALGTSAAGRLLNGPVAGWQDLANRLSVTTAVVSAAYASRTFLKTVFMRTRPWAVDDPVPDDPDAFQSFPSGHSILAWACVGDALIGLIRGDVPAWSLAVLTLEAGATSVLRVLSGEHYPGDVAAGAAFGLVVGSAVSAVLLPAEDALH